MTLPGTDCPGSPGGSGVASCRRRSNAFAMQGQSMTGRPDREQASQPLGAHPRQRIPREHRGQPTLAHAQQVDRVTIINDELDRAEHLEHAQPRFVHGPCL